MYSISGEVIGSRSRASPSISSAIWSASTPCRISGSWTYRWNSRTSASAILRIDCA